MDRHMKRREDAAAALMGPEAPAVEEGPGQPSVRQPQVTPKGEEAQEGAEDKGGPSSQGRK